MPVLEVIPRGHVMRELSTEIARLTNEMAGLRATPAVPQGRSVWLLFREDDESDAVMMYFEKPDETGFKDRFKLREFVLVERATTAPAPAQEVGLTDEEIEAIAKKHMSTVGDHWCNEDAIRERHAEDFARAIIAALRAKGGGHGG